MATNLKRRIPRTQRGPFSVYDLSPPDPGDIKAVFAYRIKERMLALRISGQSELARAAGVFLPKGMEFGRDTISRWRKGKNLPDETSLHLQALAKALKCTVRDLIPADLIAKSQRCKVWTDDTNPDLANFRATGIPLELAVKLRDMVQKYRP